MNKTSPLYKIGFMVYWLLFAMLTVYLGQFPGYVQHPETAPYPWLAVILVCLFLAILLAAFYFLLLPPLFRFSWWRLPASLALGAALLAASLFTFVTDMPGYYYVPHYFSFFTVLFLLVVSVSSIVGFIWRKTRAP